MRWASVRLDGARSRLSENGNFVVAREASLRRTSLEHVKGPAAKKGHLILSAVGHQVDVERSLGESSPEPEA